MAEQRLIEVDAINMPKRRIFFTAFEYEAQGLAEAIERHGAVVSQAYTDAPGVLKYVLVVYPDFDLDKVASFLESLGEIVKPSAQPAQETPPPQPRVDDQKIAEDALKEVLEELG